jgi:uncharacterized membrane protein YphA (DoxX/SURF4 family)
MNLIRLMARPLLAAPFIADGWSAVRDPDPHVKRLECVRPIVRKVGVDLSDEQLRLATRAMGAATIGAGAALSLGIGQRGAATVLAATALPLAVVNHPVWTASSREERSAGRDGLMRSLALFGGLVVASMDRRGKPSVGWRRRNRREQRAALREAKARARQAVDA